MIKDLILNRLMLSPTLMMLNFLTLPLKRFSKKPNKNSKVSILKLMLVNLLKVKKCQLTLTFINSTLNKKLHSSINKIRCFLLIFGQHGVGLVKSLCSTINKCYKKMKKNGKIKLELLP